jgi:transposase InsO family protein
LRAQFSRHGVPSKVISDNGPQFFSSDFADFAKTYEFVHVTSSPGYPQSNGQAENAVKNVKRIMKKSLKSGEDPFLALLSWRNTPSEGLNSSPVQRLYGRRTRTLLPTTNTLRKPKRVTHVKKEMTVRKNKQKQYYDSNTKSLND